MSKKKLYNDLKPGLDPDYLVKCHQVFFEVVKQNNFTSYSHRNIIDFIAEPVITYFYIKSVNDEELNNGINDLRDIKNMKIKLRMRRLIKWRLDKYVACSDFSINSGIAIIDDLFDMVPGDQYEDLVDEYEMNLILDVLTSTIESLPNKQKLTIKYFYYQDFKIKQIAQILEVSEETVKSNKRDAMKKLRSKLITFFELVKH